MISVLKWWPYVSSIHFFPYLAVVTSQSRWVDYGGPKCGENHINFVAFSKHFVGKNKTLLYKNPSELSELSFNIDVFLSFFGGAI